jgi:glycosyltransferase involved in cell wall biosynthesis
MMRVVMAGPLPPMIGGMTTVIDDIAHSSLAQEADLVLFDTAKKTPEGRSLFQAIAARFALWRSWWSLMTPSGQTIAHIHTCSGLSFFLDGAYLLISRLGGVPVVLHVHGARFDEFLDSLPPSALFIARFIARRANRVVVLSHEWEKKLAVRLPGARLSVIENGVSIPGPVPSDKAKDETLILFLGNLCQRKGVWDLLACSKSLPPGVRLVLVGGEEDPGIAEKIREQLKRDGLQDRVELTGPLTGESKFDRLYCADIFALPSYAEGVPISMLEAAAAGLPLVVTPVGGIPSVLTDGENALFVAPGDRDALLASLLRLIGAPELGKRLGDAAKRHVLERYGIENSARQYLELYKTIQTEANA